MLCFDAILVGYWKKKKDKNIPSIYKNFMNACGGVIREEVYFRSNIKWKLDDYMHFYILHYFLYYNFIKYKSLLSSLKNGL